MLFDLLKAAILGMVEGLTEFLPVSSTGHLLLLGHFFGFDDAEFGKTFTVLIQLGAILAILSVYFARLWRLATGFFTDARARRFVFGVLLAFLPAAVVGVLAHGFIKAALFNVWIVCSMLVIGGFVLLAVDRMSLKARHHDAQEFTLPMYLGIGIFQVLAMVPGVSRSGATIVGALLLGADRRAAAEFSFWLAMPTMVGAFTVELYRSAGELSADSMLVVAVGFVASFICGWIVVKTFLGYLTSHSFALFAWWRIVLGGLGLLALWLGY